MMTTIISDKVKINVRFIELFTRKTSFIVTDKVIMLMIDVAN